MTAGGSVALLGHENQEVTVWGMRASELPPTVTLLSVSLQCDLPGKLPGPMSVAVSLETSSRLCRQRALVGVRGEAADQEQGGEDGAPTPVPLTYKLTCSIAESQTLAIKRQSYLKV